MSAGPGLPAPLRAGDPAPELALPDQRGAVVRLADLRGRRVVVWFYPQADTPGCAREGCNFRDLAADYAARGAAIVGVSCDPPAEVAAFAAKYRIGYPLLSDADGAAARAWGAWDPAAPGRALRNTYVVGPDGRVERVLAGVNPKTHPRALLGELPAGAGPAGQPAPGAEEGSA